MNDQRESAEQQSFFRTQLPLEQETCWFVLLNALDVFVTYLLLQTGEFRESNGIANYFLTRFGMHAMVYFKFAIVAIVVVIAQIVARKKLRTARWLLIGGSMLVGAVVVYSCLLLMHALANT